MAVTKTPAKKTNDEGTAQSLGGTVDTTNVPLVGTEHVPDHPSIDKEPRKEMPAESNQIDFNDPTLTPEEAVEENLTGSTAASDDD